MYDRKTNTIRQDAFDALLDRVAALEADRDRLRAVVRQALVDLVDGRFVAATETLRRAVNQQ